MKDDSLQVRAGEYGRLRVFALAPNLVRQMVGDDDPAPLMTALGIRQMTAADVQLVDLAALGDLTLTDFLHAAYEVAPADTAPLAAELNGLRGHVAILRSGAFGGQAVTLALSDAARLVAVLTEPGLEIAPTLPLPAGGAAGVVPGGKPGPSQAAIMGRVAMVALLVIFALTVLMVWIAG